MKPLGVVVVRWSGNEEQGWRSRGVGYRATIGTGRRSGIQGASTWYHPFVQVGGFNGIEPNTRLPKSRSLEKAKAKVVDYLRENGINAMEAAF